MYHFQHEFTSFPLSLLVFVSFLRGIITTTRPIHLDLGMQEIRVTRNKVTRARYLTGGHKLNVTRRSCRRSFGALNSARLYSLGRCLARESETTVPASENRLDRVRRIEPLQHTRIHVTCGKVEGARARITTMKQNVNGDEDETSSTNRRANEGLSET